MIAHLSGRLVFKSPDTVIVEVNGVGYEVSIPLSTYYDLPALNSHITLKTHTFLREDSLQLFGFLTQEEREIFQMLITVSGIGPRLARNIISGLPAVDIASSIAGGDLVSLSSIPGVGKKTAERLVVELKDKVKKLAVASKKPSPSGKDSLIDDCVSALNNLGYKTAEAEEASRKASVRLGQTSGFEELFKETLKILSSK